MPSSTIMVVEDHDDTRESLAQLLEQNGYAVATARNGADALRQLRDGLQPGLILLDLHMPDKNGWQFRVEQVLDPRLEKIPVIAYSADEEAYASGIRLGAVACLRKPFGIPQLMDLVQRHCPLPRG